MTPQPPEPATPQTEAGRWLLDRLAPERDPWRCPLFSNGEHVTYGGICHCGWSRNNPERPGRASGPDLMELARSIAACEAESRAAAEGAAAPLRDRIAALEAELRGFAKRVASSHRYPHGDETGRCVCAVHEDADRLAATPAPTAPDRLAKAATAYFEATAREPIEGGPPSVAYIQRRTAITREAREALREALGITDDPPRWHDAARLSGEPVDPS